MRKFLMAACAIALLAGSAKAQGHTETLNWTWPTKRADGVTTMPLASYGGVQVYDTGTPVPGLPGTLIQCAVTLPPTTATGTCTTGVLTAGTHGFVVITTDNASPPDVSPPSNAVSNVVVPLSGPAAITDLKGTLN